MNVQDHESLEAIRGKKNYRSWPVLACVKITLCTLYHVHVAHRLRQWLKKPSLLRCLGFRTGTLPRCFHLISWPCSQNAAPHTANDSNVHCLTPTALKQSVFIKQHSTHTVIVPWVWQQNEHRSRLKNVASKSFHCTCRVVLEVEWRVRNTSGKSLKDWHAHQSQMFLTSPTARVVMN